MDAGTRCGRCGGRVITDAREAERYCLACGARPIDADELAATRASLAVEEAFHAGKRWRSPSIQGLKLA